MRSLVNAVTRHTILTAVFLFALAASVAAAQQRGGGGGRSGGGRSGGGHSGGDHSGGAHTGGGRPHGHFDGRPHGRVGGPGGHFGGPHGHIIVGGTFYDPFWGPFYPYGYRYPYGYGYPDWPYDYSSNITGDLKTDITPKQTEVYVDGYYAGVADDFDGAFQRLDMSPGGHAVTLRLEGYRTVTRNIYVRSNSTYKLKETMEKLAPGEVSEPVPGPTLPTGSSDGTSTPDGASAPQR
jgi:PEGA domain